MGCSFTIAWPIPKLSVFWRTFLVRQGSPHVRRNVRVLVVNEKKARQLIERSYVRNETVSITALFFEIQVCNRVHIDSVEEVI
jgi:hypothetical protein